MTIAKNDASIEASVAASESLSSYEPPRITWVESYEPVGLAVSCNHSQGDPACYPGPLGS